MSQSYVQFYTHIVFHTKNNVKFIREDIEDELYSYLGGILKNYIRNQKEHHKKVEFIDEYKSLLKEYGISFEERYL